MANAEDRGYKFEFLGWMKEGNHDKVWGYIRLNSGSIYNFWCRRGGTLKFKRHYDIWELQNLARKKEAKGYQPLTEAKLEVVWPGFGEDFGNKFIMAKFSGEIKTDSIDDDSNQSFI
jgi:hypothetical protein